MNINVLISKIKKRAGLNGILADIYDDTLLKDIIMNDSLITFNRYNSFTIRMAMDTLFNSWERKPVDSSNGMDVEVMIPDTLLAHFKSLGCEVIGAYLTRRVVYPLAGILYSRGMQDDLTYLHGNQIARANYDLPKILFKAPNTLVLKDWGLSTYAAPLAYLLHLKCTHPRNLCTITKGVEEIFEELCYVDILLNLYNNELKFMNITTGSSSVDMNVEPFASAEGKRDEILDKIRRKASYDNMILDF